MANLTPLVFAVRRNDFEHKEVTFHPLHSIYCTNQWILVYDDGQNNKNNPRNYPTMVDFGSGTPLVHLDTRKMKKLSHKDLIVALGILVAAFTVITSVYFKDTAIQRNSKLQEKKIKPAAILETVVQKFYSHTSL